MYLALKTGFIISDLEKLRYIDVISIIIKNNVEDQEHNATQIDIDMLAR